MNERARYACSRARFVPDSEGTFVPATGRETTWNTGRARLHRDAYLGRMDCAVGRLRWLVGDSSSGTGMAPGTTLEDIGYEATIGEIHVAMERGAITASELTQWYLDRIDTYDDELGSILYTNDAATERAKTLDRLEGFAGPLHGIPVILKDNHDTHDMPTSAGSTVLAESKPVGDAHVVSQLREAGAIVLAKANLHEFSFGVDTISALGGSTRNPYDTDRRPGGSSGGTVAAIAANLGCVGTGSDTCSSVRCPPAFTGLVGVRPTRGLVSRTGIVPLSETQDIPGPITRTVGDAATLLTVMAGFDPEDPVTGRGFRHFSPPRRGSPVTPADLDDVRVGVLRQAFEPADPDQAAALGHSQVMNVTETAMNAIDAAGATLIDPVAGVERGKLIRARVLEFEFARDFDQYLKERRPNAPVSSLAELVETGEVAKPVAERIRGEDILDLDCKDPEQTTEYLSRLRLRTEVRDETLALLAEHDLDAVIYPPSRVLPVRVGEQQPFTELNCQLAAHTGLPAVTIPAGQTDAGLPVGIEILGRPFEDWRLLDIAAALEATLEGRVPPSGFGPDG